MLGSGWEQQQEGKGFREQSTPSPPQHGGYSSNSERCDKQLALAVHALFSDC